MPTLKNMPDDAGPPAIYTKYPQMYGPWSAMSEALMNGPSPLSQAERELIFAYAAGVGDCPFVYIAHSEVAYARGIERGLLENLLQDLDGTSIEPRMKALLSFVRKLTLGAQMSQADAQAVFDAGLDEHALHDAIALTARAAFMKRLVDGYAFKPLTRGEAAVRASRRIEKGYVNLYPAFKEAEKK